MKFNLRKLLTGEDIAENSEAIGMDDENGGYEDDTYAEENQSYEPVRQSQGTSVSMSSGSSIEMKVIKPEGFDSAKQIADLLLSRKTVLLNLEDTNKETARRLIDFLSGIAYAINGDLNRVANNTFVIAPQNVKVSDEQISESTQA